MTSPRVQGPGVVHDLPLPAFPTQTSVARPAAPIIGDLLQHKVVEGDVAHKVPLGAQESHQGWPDPPAEEGKQAVAAGGRAVAVATQGVVTGSESRTRPRRVRKSPDFFGSH